MRRREFITLFGGAVTAWPLSARAQQPVKLPTIGYLGSTSREVEAQRIVAFVQRLRELGWIDGKTVAIEYRWSEGHDERNAEIAAEFVRLKVDVILTAGSSLLAAKKATSVIPIVFAVAADPLGTGAVASLSRPGGNITGLSNLVTEVAAKRLELLREVVPNLRHAAVMANTGYPAAVNEMHEVQKSARVLGLDAVALEIRQAEDIAPAFAALKDRAEALYVCVDALVNTYRVQINSLALGARLPTMRVTREDVEAGGLMSYGANVPDLYRRSAEYVDKILRGAKPGDLPVEQPTKFELIVNLKVAKELGLDVPAKLLALADAVIE